MDVGKHQAGSCFQPAAPQKRKLTAGGRMGRAGTTPEDCSRLL